MHIDNLLSRLEKVKQTNSDQYVACCPAHKDKSPSLSIKVLPDGKILLHCFAECSIDEVLSSIGLALENLFPLRLEVSKPIKRKISSSAALEIIYFDGLVIQTTARMIINKELLVKKDFQRVTTSFMRINSAYDYFKD
jgi:hypothetical protein